MKGVRKTMLAENKTEYLDWTCVPCKKTFLDYVSYRGHRKEHLEVEAEKARKENIQFERILKKNYKYDKSKEGL